MPQLFGKTQVTGLPLNPQTYRTPTHQKAPYGASFFFNKVTCCAIE